MTNGNNECDDVIMVDDDDDEDAENGFSDDQTAQDEALARRLQVKHFDTANRLGAIM